MREREREKTAVTSLDAGSAGRAASKNRANRDGKTHEVYGSPPTRSQFAAYHPLFPSCTPKKTEEEGAGAEEGGVETEDGGKGGARWEMGL